MKFNIIKRNWKPDYYHREESTDFIIQKKGWFGWKTLNDIYDGNWASHYGWRYYPPGRNSFHDTFPNKDECILFLKTMFKPIEPKITYEEITI